MSWKTVATVLIVVFSVVLIQSAVADPLVQTTDTLKETGDYSNEHFDGESLIDEFVSSWFNMGLVAIFGIMVWGVRRAVDEAKGGGGVQ